MVKKESKIHGELVKERNMIGGYKLPNLKSIVVINTSQRRTIKATPIVRGNYAKQTQIEAMSKPSEASIVRNRRAHDLVRQLRSH
ncbi:MAG: hypothetical protein M0T74_01725 [Desulfitobacterium hafniense]|nr:hypothetical protein [Desulfitobacterium hafniense]